MSTTCYVSNHIHILLTTRLVFVGWFRRVLTPSTLTSTHFISRNMIYNIECTIDNIIPYTYTPKKTSPDRRTSARSWLRFWCCKRILTNKCLPLRPNNHETTIEIHQELTLQWISAQETQHTKWAGARRAPANTAYEMGGRPAGARNVLNGMRKSQVVRRNVAEERT